MQKLLLIYLILCCCSCRTRLKYDFEKDCELTLAPHWQTGYQPEGAIFNLYSNDSKELINIYYLPYWGGKINLEGNIYSLVSYNDYNYKIKINRERGGLQAELLPYKGPNLFGNTDQESIIGLNAPFHLAKKQSFKIRENEKLKTINIYPIRKDIEIQIKVLISGEKYLEQAQAKLSGIARCLDLMTGKCNNNSSSHFFLNFDLQKRYLVAKFSCFGFVDKEATPNIIEFAFKTKDGKIQNKSITRDITSKITKDIKKKGGIIILNNLDITIPKVKLPQNGGFEFSVEGFGEAKVEEVDI